MSYQMHRPGFDRRAACRGHFGGVPDETPNLEDLPWATPDGEADARKALANGEVEYVIEILCREAATNEACGNMRAGGALYDRADDFAETTVS